MKRSNLKIQFSAGRSWKSLPPGGSAELRDSVNRGEIRVLREQPGGRRLPFMDHQRRRLATPEEVCGVSLPSYRLERIYEEALRHCSKRC